jgi:hypothetical protein
MVGGNHVQAKIPIIRGKFFDFGVGFDKGQRPEFMTIASEKCNVWSFLSLCVGFASAGLSEGALPPRRFLAFVMKPSGDC